MSDGEKRRGQLDSGVAAKAGSTPAQRLPVKAATIKRDLTKNDTDADGRYIDSLMEKIDKVPWRDPRAASHGPDQAAYEAEPALPPAPHTDAKLTAAIVQEPSLEPTVHLETPLDASEALPQIPETRSLRWALLLLAAAVLAIAIIVIARRPTTEAPVEGAPRSAKALPQRSGAAPTVEARPTPPTIAAPAFPSSSPVEKPDGTTTQAAGATPEELPSPRQPTPRAPRPPAREKSPAARSPIQINP